MNKNYSQLGIFAEDSSTNQLKKIQEELTENAFYVPN